jgi:hypothetical protein
MEEKETTITNTIRNPPKLKSPNKGLELALKGKPYSSYLDIETDNPPLHFVVLGLPSEQTLYVDEKHYLTGEIVLPHGDYPIDILCVDEAGEHMEFPFVLEVKEEPVILDEEIPEAIIGEAFEWSPTIGGSKENLDYSIGLVSGYFPNGMYFKEDGHYLAGKPTTPGQQCEIEVIVSNDYNLVGVSKRFIFKTMIPVEERIPFQPMVGETIEENEPIEYIIDEEDTVMSESVSSVAETVDLVYINKEEELSKGPLLKPPFFDGVFNDMSSTGIMERLIERRIRNRQPLPGEETLPPILSHILDRVEVAYLNGEEVYRRQTQTPPK